MLVEQERTDLEEKKKKKNREALAQSQQGDLAASAAQNAHRWRCRRHGTRGDSVAAICGRRRQAYEGKKSGQVEAPLPEPGNS